MIKKYKLTNKKDKKHDFYLCVSLMYSSPQHLSLSHALTPLVPLSVKAKRGMWLIYN